ncbi:unnamed protein product [Linum trigynum]|uniref:Uncharacterized protein n=1 Tax=Linum trigynum TaxID=586398 RepID=A0AAV2DZU0_9ROSI
MLHIVEEETIAQERNEQAQISHGYLYALSLVPRGDGQWGLGLQPPLSIPRQRMGEEMKADRIIRNTVQLEPVCQLQKTGQMHPGLLILQAMELDRGCDELNPAWLDLEVVCWNRRVEDDRADVSNPRSVVVFLGGTRLRWMMNSMILGYGVVPQDLIHRGNLLRIPLVLIVVSVHPVLFFRIATQVAVYALFRSQSSSLLSPELATGAINLWIQRQ